MSDKAKYTDNVLTTIPHERRDFLKAGVSMAVAEMIKAKTNGDMYRIETVKTYPMKTPVSIEIPRQELESGNLQDLKGTPPDLSDPNRTCSQNGPPERRKGEQALGRTEKCIWSRVTLSEKGSQPDRQTARKVDFESRNGPRERVAW